MGEGGVVPPYFQSSGRTALIEKAGRRIRSMEGRGQSFFFNVNVWGGTKPSAELGPSPGRDLKKKTDNSRKENGRKFLRMVDQILILWGCFGKFLGIRGLVQKGLVFQGSRQADTNVMLNFG